MSIIEIKKLYKKFCDLIDRRKVKEAFDLLYEIIKNYNLDQFKFTLDNYYETYKNILKYSFELVEDPEKEKIYTRLIKSLLEITNEIYESIVVNNKYLSYYNLKKSISSYSHLSSEASTELFQKLVFEKEFEKLLDENQMNSTKESPENIINGIFLIIWFSNTLKETETKLIIELCKEKTVSWYDKSIVVSALTLSLLRYFDQNKFKMLFEFLNSKIDQVWQRAMVGIFFNLLRYNNRLKLYPEIIFQLQELSESNSFKIDLENIIIQYIRSKDTEKITKKLKEEILPEMMKYKSELEEKLDLDKIISEKYLEDKNPEWETVFKDSPGLYDKLEEFSKLQVEGADVFISAFSMLKHFNFFNQIQNWFLPFYKENNTIITAVKEFNGTFDESELINGIEQSSFLCNSDKYSFCLNLQFLPSTQKEMIANLFNMELKAMNEMEMNDQLINSSAKNKVIFKQYMQDLYRFYKLHPLKHEFEDIFDNDIKIKDSVIFNKIIEDKSVIRNIGEFYFEQGHYHHALEIFILLAEKGKNLEVLEKIGYCYQQLNNYTNALDYYLKAELLDKNKLWLLKKIAHCYRVQGNYKKSAEYLNEAERIEPEDLYIQTYLGNAYMDMKDYETALKFYYKVEYLDTKNHKVQRPIAWCSFMLGKFEAAQKYLKKAILLENNKNDFLNLGHIEWCMENKSEAIKNYRQAVINSGNDFSWFSTEFSSDSEYLVRFGINPLDIPLMEDFIRISVEKEEQK